MYSILFILGIENFIEIQESLVIGHWSLVIGVWSIKLSARGNWFFGTNPCLHGGEKEKCPNYAHAGNVGGITSERKGYYARKALFKMVHPHEHVAT